MKKITVSTKDSSLSFDELADILRKRGLKVSIEVKRKMSRFEIICRLLAPLLLVMAGVMINSAWPWAGFPLCAGAGYLQSHWFKNTWPRRDEP